MAYQHQVSMVNCLDSSQVLNFCGHQKTLEKIEEHYEKIKQQCLTQFRWWKQQLSVVSKKILWEDIDTLCKSISKQSNIYNLQPFLNEKDILRVGGRIMKSTLEYKLKYPILLLRKISHITSVFLEVYHHKKINRCLTDINQCLTDIFKI